jgi:hypothetical protein
MLGILTATAGEAIEHAILPIPAKVTLLWETRLTDSVFHWHNYRTGPINSRDLVPIHLLNYSRNSGIFSRSKIFGASLILIIHGMDYTFTVKE